MAKETRVGPSSELPPGAVTGAGEWAVGNAGGDVFALSRRCRHLAADPMVRGPQGVFARIPGLGALNIAFTKLLPLRRREVVDRDGTLYVR